MNSKILIGIGILGGIIAAIYFLTRAKKPGEGEQKCEGFDLYEYHQGEWELMEVNSAVCGWQPIGILLITGPNTIHYTGTTTKLPEALTNIKDFVEIVWYQTPSGQWQRFFFYDGYSMGELEKLEYDKDYIITVTTECVWNFPGG